MDTTSFQEDYGFQGSNPRDRMPPGASKMPVFKHALTYGTPKGTLHIPGYSGFLPTNLANPRVAKAESGMNLRSTDKSNLTEQFHVNLLSYAGHVPTNPNNDTGGVKVHTQTEFGRSFRRPAAGME